jgi:hypothetical protein
MTNAYFRWSFFIADYLVVPVTLIDILINFNTLQPMAAQNASQQHSFTIFSIFPFIRNLCSGSYSYHNTEVNQWNSCVKLNFLHYLYSYNKFGNRFDH